MKIKWQKNADSQAEAAENHYPRFEAWYPGDPEDKRWQLVVKRSATDPEPIRIRNLPGPEAVEEFVRGWLTGQAHYSDNNLPVTILYSARETQTACAAKAFSRPSSSLPSRSSTDVRSKRRILFPPQTA